MEDVEGLLVISVKAFSQNKPLYVYIRRSLHILHKKIGAFHSVCPDVQCARLLGAAAQFAGGFEALPASTTWGPTCPGPHIFSALKGAR